MSDSDPEPPSLATVADGIRDIVISLHKAGNADALTVNNVRSGVEQKLGLSKGFLKNGDWKDRSKTWIKEAADRYVEDPAPAPSPKRPVKTQTKPRPASKSKPNSTIGTASRGAKRKAAAPAKKPKKRRKTTSSEEESEAASSNLPSQDSDLSDAESVPPKQPARRRTKPVIEDSGEEENVPRKPTQDAREHVDSDEKVRDAEHAKRPATPPPPAQIGASDDDMSDVLDDTPVKSKRKQKAEKVIKTAKGVKAQSKATKAKPADDPEQAEVKRLQGWLVKCGIRKVWGKELKDCETSKDKIRHLKAMLKEAGMDGKYSVEKAAKIKEQREFAKDLEDIQAGAAVWGDSSSTGRPRRAAAARAVQPAAAPIDTDDEENDDGAQDNRTEDDDDDDDDDEAHEESNSDDVKSGNDDEDNDEMSD